MKSCQRSHELHVTAMAGHEVPRFYTRSFRASGLVPQQQLSNRLSLVMLVSPEGGQQRGGQIHSCVSRSLSTEPPPLYCW